MKDSDPVNVMVLRTSEEKFLLVGRESMEEVFPACS